MDIKEVFLKGRRNDEYFRKINNQTLTWKESFKYLIWINSLLIFSNKKEIETNNVYILYGEMHNKIFNSVIDEEKIYHGSIINNFSRTRTMKSIVGTFSCKERIKILFIAMKMGLKNKISFKEFGFWLDFNILNFFVKNKKIEKITICGHFDRYAIWISHLGNIYNKRIEISQHGAISVCSLPAKTYCDTCYVFNESEKLFFRKYVIENNNCEFIVKGFQTGIQFEKIKNKKNKIYIGIASQPTYTEETFKIANYINEKYGEEVELYIYPHPREKVEGSMLNEYNIFTNVKHKNIDVLVTFFSTVVYDFLEENGNVKVICLPPEDIDMSFFQLDQVNVIRQESQFIPTLTKLISNFKEQRK